MKKLISLFFSIVLVTVLSLPVMAAGLFGEDFSDPSKLTYFVFENDGFIVQDGAFVAKSSDKYNAAYYGQYYESCVYEFDFKDFGEGGHIGGASLRVGSARYDVEVRSDAVGDDEKIVVWKGGPNKKASNTMKTTGKGIPSIPQGKWVNIKIAMTKDTIKVYVNDTLYLDYKDALPYTTGGFGIRSANSKIGYDNIKMYDLADLKLNPAAYTSSSVSTSSSKVSTASSRTDSTAVSTGNSSMVQSSETGISSDSILSESGSAVSETLSSEAPVNSSEVSASDESSSASDTDKKTGNNTLIYIVIVAAVILAGGITGWILYKKKK